MNQSKKESEYSGDDNALMISMSASLKRKNLSVFNLSFVPFYFLWNVHIFIFVIFISKLCEIWWAEVFNDALK